MAQLFGKDRTVIGRHIRNVFDEGGDPKVACANFVHTTPHCAIKGESQTQEVMEYNLDVVISVRYRVHSFRGVEFRRWATKILHNYIIHDEPHPITRFLTCLKKGPIKMNLIQEELSAASKEMLETISTAQQVELVALSRRNVAKVEAMIANDSSYLNSRDQTRMESTAYCMCRLGKVLKGQKLASEEELKNILHKAVNAVDRENNTHLNADGIGREEMFRRIWSRKDRLLEDIRDRTRGYGLIKELARRTDPGKKDGKKACSGRRNPSFASKFCHYAAFYFFEGEAAQDNYSIYDGVVKGVLPLYLAHYEITEYKDEDLEIYENYQNAIDMIRGKVSEGISRNGFDHLLWYYFKGRKI